MAIALLIVTILMVLLIPLLLAYTEHEHQLRQRRLLRKRAIEDANRMRNK
jgi:CHASE1-domain containing sensor protein